MKKLNIINFKNILLGISFLMIPKNHFSQNEKVSVNYDYKGYMLFTIGGSIPLGNLGKQDASVNEAGLAKTGIDLKLSGGYLISKNIGICASLFNKSFQVNEKLITEEIQKTSPNAKYLVTFDKGWNFSGVLAGAYFDFPIDENEVFIIEPKLMLGAAVGQSPDFTSSAKVSGFNDPIKVHQYRKSSAPVFAYALGTSLKMNSNDHVFFSFNIDYCGIAPKTSYTSVKVDDNLGNSSTTNFDMSMQSLNITFGIGLKFGE